MYVRGTIGIVGVALILRINSKLSRSIVLAFLVFV